MADCLDCRRPQAANCIEWWNSSQPEGKREPWHHGHPARPMCAAHDEIAKQLGAEDECETVQQNLPFDMCPRCHRDKADDMLMFNCEWVRTPEEYPNTVCGFHLSDDDDMVADCNFARRRWMAAQRRKAKTATQTARRTENA